MLRKLLLEDGRIQFIFSAATRCSDCCALTDPYSLFARCAIFEKGLTERAGLCYDRLPECLKAEERMKERTNSEKTNAEK